MHKQEHLTTTRLELLTSEPYQKMLQVYTNKIHKHIDKQNIQTRYVNIAHKQNVQTYCQPRSSDQWLLQTNLAQVLPQ